MSVFLRVLTLNTWGIAFSSDKPRRIQAIAAHLAEWDYDLVGLQEVWEADDLQTLVKGAKNGGLPHYHHFPSGMVGSGLVIFSRYPITDVHFHRFRTAAASRTYWRLEYLGGKGVGMVRVETPSGSVDVYNTHAVAQYNPDSIDENKPHRAAQMYEITQFVNQHTAENPLIFFGDFNTLPRHIGYRVMTRLLNTTDSFFALHPEDPGFTYSTKNPYNDSVEKQPERIDYVFIRKGRDRVLIPQEAEVCLQTYEDIAYSDHYGVRVKLEMQAGVVSDTQASAATAQTVIEEIRLNIMQGIEEVTKTQYETQWRMRFGMIGGVLLALTNIPLVGRLVKPPLLLVFSGFTFVNFIVAYFAIRGEINTLKAVLSEIETRHFAESKK